MSGRRWITLLLAVALMLCMALMVMGLVNVSRPVSSELKIPVPPGHKLAALTFDDGPHPEHTRALLDGLQQRGIQATFFLVGTQLPYAPELVERMVREGHQIGIHTLEHVAVGGLSREEFLYQVEGMRRELYPMVGEQELWLRPPYGLINDESLAWADSPVILWSVDPEDWKDTDAARVTEHIAAQTRDGDIILAHDIYPSTVEGVLAGVDRLREQGFEFVTVARLMELRGVTPQSGQIYRSVP